MVRVSEGGAGGGSECTTYVTVTYVVFFPWVGMSTCWKYLGSTDRKVALVEVTSNDKNSIRMSGLQRADDVIEFTERPGGVVSAWMDVNSSQKHTREFPWEIKGTASQQ